MRQEKKEPSTQQVLNKHEFPCPNLWIYLPVNLLAKKKKKKTIRDKLDGSYLGIERCSSAPLPPLFQPSDLLPLPTAASTTCSMMIHLLRKCNYITTLFSDGQRPIPKAALFPNIAEKKRYHTSPEQKCNQNEWSSSTILSHTPEKTDRHPGTASLDPSRGPHPSARWSLWWLEPILLDTLWLFPMALWEAEPADPLLLWEVTHRSSATWFRNSGHGIPPQSTEHYGWEDQEQEISTVYQWMKPACIWHFHSYMRRLSTKELKLSNCGAGEGSRVPWTARKSNQSVLKEINPEWSLEGLILKLKLQYFGRLMWRTDSLEETLMLGKIEGRRRREQQRMRWLDGTTDSIHHWHEPEQTPRDSAGHRSVVCGSPWGHKESDMT